MSPHPRIVGRYLLFDAFAAGGMATVHLARLLGPRGFSRAVAIKQLHPQYARNAEFVAMLLDEAKLASRIRHSNVISPVDVVVLESEIFVVMDYVHGECVAQLLRQSAGPVPPPIVAAVMTQALLGLHAAHEATGSQGEPLRLVHRDVSPQNILVGEDGVTRVVDFGIAKAQGWSQTTDSGVLKGKLGYMAPEQLRLESIDRRTDIFTSGIVLWEMLTGTRMFPGETLTRVISQMAQAEVETAGRMPGELPAELWQIAAKALAFEPRNRYQTAREMAAAISAIVTPATPLEVGAWVTQLAGLPLRERALRLAELEALRLEEFTEAKSLPVPPVSPLPLAAEPAAANVGSLSPVTSADATPSASTTPLTTAERRKVPIVPLAAAAFALLGLFVIGSTVYVRATPTSQASGPDAASSKPALSAANSTPTSQANALDAASSEPALGAANSPNADAPEDARQASSEPPVVPAVTASVTPPPAQSSAALGIASHAPVDTRHAEPSLKHVINSKRSVPPPTSSARTSSAPTAARAGCAVPYVVGPDGVKRFKSECF